VIGFDGESSLDARFLLMHAEHMLRTAIVTAFQPRAHRTEPGPSATGWAARCGTGAWLTQRRVVDFGLSGAMRCR
jgi:hypothetical protein